MRSAEFFRSHRRFIVGALFAVLTIAASILLARKLTTSSWPLAGVDPLLAAAAAAAYLVSFVARARAWHRLFPRNECPGQAGCLASVGAASASGVVLPFRLDYLIKIGVLRRLGGIKVGLGAIALSIVSLGMIDAIAMLPLSISATATTNSILRGPLLIVVAFGIACSTLFVVSGRLARVPMFSRSRRLRTLASTSPGTPPPVAAGTRRSRGSTSSPAGRRARSGAPPCSARSGSRSRRRPRSP